MVWFLRNSEFIEFPLCARHRAKDLVYYRNRSHVAQNLGCAGGGNAWETGFCFTHPQSLRRIWGGEVVVLQLLVHGGQAG